MKCHEAKDVISRYIDHDLDAELTKALDEHFRTCVNCAKELESYRQLISTLKGVPEVEPPQDLARSISKHLGAKPLPEKTAEPPVLPAPRRVKFPFKIAAIGAAAVLAVIWAARSAILRIPAAAPGETAQAPVEEKITPPPAQEALIEPVAAADKKAEPAPGKNIALKAKDLAADSKEILALLYSLDTKNIDFKILPKETIFTFEIAAAQIQGLHAKLKQWQVLSSQGALEEKELKYIPFKITLID